MITVEIDALTHCLVDSSTGKEVETYAKEIVNVSELKGLTAQNGWFANWQRLLTKEKCSIYGLYVSGDATIQGLVAVMPEPGNSALYVQWIVANPQNQKQRTKEGILVNEPKCIGVGGHLFAIAADISEKMGFDGFFYGDAANSKLVEHYVEHLHAQHFPVHGHPNRIVVSENTARWLKGVYRYDMVQRNL